MLQIAEVETEKFEVEKRLQDVNIKYIQLQSQLNSDETGSSRMHERLTAALANEKRAKDQLVKIEAVVAAYESRVGVNLIYILYNIAMLLSS